MESTASLVPSRAVASVLSVSSVRGQKITRLQATAAPATEDRGRAAGAPVRAG